MQAQAALVRADGGVELDSPAAVDLNLARVVHPRYAEIEDALRLDDALHDAVRFNLRAGLNNRLEGFENLADSLQELRLVCVALLQARVNALQILIFQCHW